MGATEVVLIFWFALGARHANAFSVRVKSEKECTAIAETVKKKHAGFINGSATWLCLPVEPLGK